MYQNSFRFNPEDDAVITIISGWWLGTAQYNDYDIVFFKRCVSVIFSWSGRFETSENGGSQNWTSKACWGQALGNPSLFLESFLTLLSRFETKQRCQIHEESCLSFCFLDVSVFSWCAPACCRSLKESFACWTEDVTQYFSCWRF